MLGAGGPMEQALQSRFMLLVQGEGDKTCLPWPGLAWAVTVAVSGFPSWMQIHDIPALFGMQTCT